MEDFSPTQSDEPRFRSPPIHGSTVALVAKSLVESQDGFTNGEERIANAMVDLPRRFSDAGLVRIGQTKDPRVRNSQGDADPSKPTSEGDGGFGKANLGQSARDGMEIDLTGENNAASR